MRRLFALLLSPLTLASAQIQKRRPWRDLRSFTTTPSPLSPDARKRLSGIQRGRIGYDWRCVELGNLDGEAARARQQANADFRAMQSRRREILQVLETRLKVKWGAESWASFDSLLAVADGDYHPRREPENREMVARSPASAAR